MTIAATGDTVTYDLGNGRYRNADVIVSVDRSGNSTGAAAPLGSGVDRSGTITLGGTAQTLSAANTSRISLTGQNIDATEDLWINEIGGTAAANTAGSYVVPPRATFSIATQRAVSVVAATTGHKFTATEI
jgi:hypothetical protein